MTQKNKNIGLILGFILLLFICYKLAIINTINLRNESDSLKIEKLLFKNTPRELSILKQKQKYYDSLLNKYHLNSSSIQNNLLKTINQFTEENELILVDFLEPHTGTSDDLIIKTYQFTLEGDYNAIIKLIYNLEQKTKFGEIINLHFEKKKNFRTRKSYLQATVLLKSFG